MTATLRRIFHTPTSGALIAVMLLSLATVALADTSRQATAPDTEAGKDTPQKNLPLSDGRFMYSITLHSPKKIQSLLDRADKLSHTMRLKGNHSSISLILHGPEIRFFTRKNYKKYQSLVDKAARLDGDKLVEVKICKTKMEELGIKDEDLPSFVEIIPYAPDEEQRLLEQGYIYL